MEPTEQEVTALAEALEVSPTTVKRDWQRPQAWLYTTMRDRSRS